MEFKYFSFQASTVMEFNCWSWKVILCVARKFCRCQSKDKMKYRNVMSENISKQG